MDSLDSKYARFHIENGILIATYKNIKVITEDIAKDVVKARLRFTGEDSYAGLADIRLIGRVDLGARKYLSSEEAVKGVKAGALLTDSVFTTYLGNFFLNVTNKNMEIPNRLFNNKKNAIEWLNQYK